MIVPFPSPWHGAFVQAASDGSDLGWRVCYKSSPQLISEGLALVNNDACYDTLLAVAQAVAGVKAAVAQGANPAELTVGVPLICNQCRSVDKLFFVEHALKQAGFTQVKVVSLFDYMYESDEVSEEAQRRVAAAIAAADALLQMRTRLRPHIPEEKRTYLNAVMRSWRECTLQEIASAENFDAVDYIANLDREAAHQFGTKKMEKPIVGIAGSATAIFNRDVNGDIVGTLEAEGCEVRVPYLASIVSFGMIMQDKDFPFSQELDRICIRMAHTFVLTPTAPYADSIREAGSKYVPRHIYRGLGCAVAGWTVQLLRSGVNNIVYSSLFGCLTGHVSGVGILGAIRKDYPCANIASVEFDSGTSAMNQVNRLKLLASVAWQNMEGAQNES